MSEQLRQGVVTARAEPVLSGQTVRPGSRVHTDEYDIYARLSQWGYEHRTVCHSSGEYARDEDGDGFHEVHVNTIEGVWRPPRGHCCAPGCPRIGGSRRRSCHCTSASSSSCTTLDCVASVCFNPCSGSC